MNLAEVRRQLRRAAQPSDVPILQSFFKTGRGQYGEGDRFLGVRVPALRKLVRFADDLTLRQVLQLLHSRYHEERLLALLILVRRFERGHQEDQRALFNLYLSETRYINNWDLVDLSAPNIVGTWLLSHPRRACLNRLSASEVLWERRIAILATFTFIRHHQFDDTLRLCTRLLTDPHDLMHKACGWMLREVGKRDLAALRTFLNEHTPVMPRTMLRYAIEKLSEPERRGYLRSCR
jgi:3-methyladenine DNA glycosylase AlkD